MPQWITMAKLAKEYGLRLPEVQECARKVGVPAQKGAAKVPPAQVDRMRPELEAIRRRNQWVRNQQSSVSIELADHRVEEVQEKAPDDVVHVECACCQLTLDCRGDLGEPYCGYCRDHFQMPGESTQRKLARLSDHDQRMRAAYVRARSAYYECRGDYGARLAHMIENRNEWRAAATRLVIDHRETDKGRCGKCNQSFPCESVKILTRVNRGFARKVETLAGFSDEELERHLHPRRASASDHCDLDDEDMA
jgi:hypothetical protein